MYTVEFQNIKECFEYGLEIIFFLQIKNQLE